MRRKIEKGKLARCPYCGRYINYFFLYESKHYDFGHCSHCGGIYAVRYSGWGAGLTLLVLMLLAAGIFLQLLADGSFPSWKFYLEIALALAVIYVLIPVFIRPTKCVIDGRLGGFPERGMMPVRLQERLRNIPQETTEEELPLSEEAQKMFVAFSPEDYGETEQVQAEIGAAFAEEAPVEEATAVAAEPGEPLSAEERYRRAKARHLR